MISDFKEMNKLFEEIDRILKDKVCLFAIGGVTLLYHGMKRATKDIDLIAETKKGFDAFHDALKLIGFQTMIPPRGYEHMNINQIFIREDFRIDLFCRTVCKRFSLSEGMIKRASTVIELKNIKVSFCSNEDVFLFKTMTQRDGDLEDCMSLAQRNLNWKIILAELKKQVRASGNDVWITWVGERLDMLEEKGLNLPVMKEINKLRGDYFKTCEKRLRNK